MVLCAASTGSNTCCPLAAMVSVFEGGRDWNGGETDADDCSERDGGAGVILRACTGCEMEDSRQKVQARAMRRVWAWWQC